MTHKHPTVCSSFLFVFLIQNLKFLTTHKQLIINSNTQGVFIS